jgi:hemerythrin
MDAVVNVAEVTSTREADRQLALINWALTKIERIAARSDTDDSLDDLLDFVAHFTREYFGYQERLLQEAAAHQEHLMERRATHAEYRNRLARIFADAANGDATVARRLNAVCVELWLDVQTQRDDFSAIVHSSESAPRFRSKSRQDSEALRAILRADS